MGRSSRISQPSVHPWYTMFGSLQSTWVSKPSPASVKVQSEFTMPAELIVRDGPPRLLLSCVPM